jgi:hypothetical protein
MSDTEINDIGALSDNVDRDWVLQHLVTVVNGEADFTQPITLWTNAGIISGELISAKTYAELYSGKFLERFSPDAVEGTAKMLDWLFGGYFSDAPPMGSNTAFIHLRGAKLFLPNGVLPSSEGVLWRGRLSQITGFNLGALTKSE